MSISPAEIIVTVAALLFSVIIHECAHGWVALQLGDSTAKDAGRLTLNPLPHLDLWGSILIPLLLLASRSGFLFAWAKPVPVNRARLRRPERDDVLVSAAGPASNFLLALAAAVLMGVVLGLGLGGTTGPGVGRGTADLPMLLLSRLILINVILGLFNLLPIPPLDGSWILSSVLPPDLRRSYERIRPFGMLVLMGLMFLGGLDYLWMGVRGVESLYYELVGALAGLL